jgi:inorganic triphosphatase YgiF
VKAGRIEAELKYLAADERPLRELETAATLGPAALGPARRVVELDRYLDTIDHRLAALRWACRLRTREGRTIVSLKGPGEHRPGDLVHRRPEFEGPAGAGVDPRRWPPSEARDHLLAMTDGSPLAELLRLEQQRIERDVTVGGRRVGALSLDGVRVVSNEQEIGRLRVVELELEQSAGGGFDHRPLGEALGRLPGLVPDPMSKLERALEMLPPA